MVTTTLHEYNGDIVEVAFDSPWTATSTKVKNILTKGSAILEFPGSDMPPRTITAPGPVGPATSFVGQTAVKVTVLEDGTEAACVTPVAGYVIEVDTLNLEPPTTQRCHIAVGHLAFIFGENYTINGNRYSSFGMFAIQSTNATVQAYSPCHIVTFQAVPKGA